MARRFITKQKWIATDGWRGYSQPIYAVAGASDTGTWSDSPCPSGAVDKEIKKLKSQLNTKGFATKTVSGRSSNVFMGKRWVIVPPSQFKQAKTCVGNILKKSKNTQFIHGAD